MEIAGISPNSPNPLGFHPSGTARIPPNPREVVVNMPPPRDGRKQSGAGILRRRAISLEFHNPKEASMVSPRNLVFCYENKVFRPLRAAAIAGKSSGILVSGPTPDCISHTKTQIIINFHSISMIPSKSIKCAQIIGFNATLDNLWALGM